MKKSDAMEKSAEEGTTDISNLNVEEKRPFHPVVWQLLLIVGWDFHSLYIAFTSNFVHIKLNIKDTSYTWSKSEQPIDVLPNNSVNRLLQKSVWPFLTSVPYMPQIQWHLKSDL